MAQREFLDLSKEDSSNKVFSYPSFDSRIDGYLGPKLKRIEWAHEGVKGMPTATPYNPVTNISSPSLACRYSQVFLNTDTNVEQGQPEPRAPLLKAPVRAGAKVQFNWTPIVRMHSGPALVVSRTDQTFEIHENNKGLRSIWRSTLQVSNRTGPNSSRSGN
jgi:hypothetical protein